MVLKKGSDWRPDGFKHELVMAVVEQGELVVVSGCGHSGTLNMIDAVASELPGMPIKAVVGGFHLVGLPRLNTMAGSRLEVQDVGRQVLAYPVRETYTGHCTGRKAFRVLKAVMGGRLHALHTGMRFEL